MCGICGYNGKGNKDVLTKMSQTLSHRGPDDLGIFVDENVGLGHTRLSIIDTSHAGHQPMSNEDDSVWVAFNGEIYNFLELKQTLQGIHRWKSETDTEVIIHLYEEIGEEVFSKIHGMFAIAIYDVKKNIILLARDRMGKKPLYWSNQQNTLFFGSELKSILAHTSYKKEIDLDSVNKYFLYEYVPTPHTMFKNTYKLEPGTYLKWDGKNEEKKQFWKPTFLPKSESFSQSVSDLEKTLETSVKDRLISDVPLGIFLSGGIDSSAVAYFASKNIPNKVKTFSIGFSEKSFDESSYARKVAQSIGTEHHEKILSVNDCLEIIPIIGEFLDEPMADASIVPTYLLSKFTREHVTVALGGDGGDELFAGYDTFLAHRMGLIYEKVPKLFRKGLYNLVQRLPTSHSNMSLDFKLKKFMSGFEGNRNYRNQRWLGAFDDNERKHLLKSTVLNKIDVPSAYSDIDKYLTEIDSQKFYDQLAYVYQRMYMMDQVLVKVDRASMMNSLEVRAPFLDTRMVDLANHMPHTFKMKRMTRKYILKKMLEGKITKDIIYRKKKGFGMPVAEWINGGLKPMILDLLGRESIKSMNLFNYEYIESLLNDHFEMRRDNRKQIWTLLMFSMWWRKWMS